MLIASLPLVLGACRKSPSNNFSVALKSTFYRIANTADWSCLASTSNPPDIQAANINLRGFDVIWKGENPLVLESAQIVLSSPEISGGGFEKDLAGVDFNGLFSGSTGTAPSVAVGETKVTTCDAKFGGIQLGDPERPTFGSGYLKIRGYTRDGEIDVAVSGQAYFNFEYTPD